MNTNPLESISKHVGILENYGLVTQATDGGTSGYQITDDGLLYIDGMFCHPRKCSTHPNPMDDLNAVSRGRFMMLEAEELKTLAVIFIGAEFTNHIVDCAVRMNLEEGTHGALTTLSGAIAHGMRHARGNRNGKDAYQKQLSVCLQDRNEKIRNLVEAALESWPITISATGHGLDSDALKRGTARPSRKKWWNLFRP